MSTPSSVPGIGCLTVTVRPSKCSLSAASDWAARGKATGEGNDGREPEPHSNPLMLLDEWLRILYTVYVTNT